MWEIILVALAAGATAQNIVPINVVPGSGLQRLNAYPQDTIYDLTSAPHSRIIAQCALDQRLNCWNTVFEVSLNGAQWKNVCNTGSQYLSSEFNQMKIRASSTTGIQPIVCDYSATPPYVGLHGQDPDSSEAGIEGLTAGKPTCRCGWANKNNGRIVGGKIAQQNEFSFPIRMILNGQPHCGGSIITPWHALTAAHCTEPFNGQQVDLRIAVGEYDISYSPHRSIHRVARIVQHEGYNKHIFLNDITILVLADKIQYNNLIGPVCMPNGIPRSLVNDHIKVLGWGRTTDGGNLSSVLKKLNMAVLDPKVCVAIYPYIKNDGKKICTYRDQESSCQGDSGGPLVWRSPNTNMFVQAALVSFGAKCASKDPSVNTDVQYYLPWITKTVQETSPEPTQMCYSN